MPYPVAPWHRRVLRNGRCKHCLPVHNLVCRAAVLALGMQAECFYMLLYVVLKAPFKMEQCAVTIKLCTASGWEQCGPCVASIGA